MCVDAEQECSSKPPTMRVFILRLLCFYYTGTILYVTQQLQHAIGQGVLPFFASKGVSKDVLPFFAI